MSQHSLLSPFVELRTPPILRALALFALVFTPLLAFISFMAWWVEDAQIGLWMLPVWLGMALYWLWQWRVWAQRMRLYADRVEILMPFAPPRQLPYARITALKLEHGALHIVASADPLRLRGDANTLAQMATALEQRVPTLGQVTARESLLPLVVNAQTQSILIANGFGLLIAARGIGLLNAAIREVEMEGRFFAMGFSLVMLAIGGIFLYWLFVSFVWRYRFTRDRIEVRHTLHSEVYQPAQLAQVTMQQQSVTSRGVTRILYTLELAFADGQKLIVQPGAQNYPFDYAENYEEVRLSKLLAQLTAMYHDQLHPSPVTRTELDVNKLPWVEATLPDYAYQLHSQPVDFTVTVLNYGERQPGAETVELRLSRAVMGVDIFHTTNGVACFSASGHLLLLHTLFTAVVIDCESRLVWHRTVRNRALYLDLGWEGEMLQGKILGYGKNRSEAELFGPWDLEEIMLTWQPGLGKASKGDLV